MISWQQFILTPDEVAVTEQALRKHVSKYKSSPKYLLSFVCANELFGDFPTVVLESKLPASDNQLHKDLLAEMPEELMGEEQVDFISVEGEILYLEGDNLVFTLHLSRPLGEMVNVSLYACGCRKDIPFAEMPKLHIEFKKDTYEIDDQEVPLPKDTVLVERQEQKLTIRILLKALKSPQRVLTSARTTRGFVPLDWVECGVDDIGE